MSLKLKERSTKIKPEVIEEIKGTYNIKGKFWDSMTKEKIQFKGQFERKSSNIEGKLEDSFGKSTIEGTMKDGFIELTKRYNEGKSGWPNYTFVKLKNDEWIGFYETEGTSMVPPSLGYAYCTISLIKS